MEVQTKQIPLIPVLCRRDRLTIPRIPAHSGPAIQTLIEALNRCGAKPAGGDIIYIYHDCDGDLTAEFDLEICLPIAAGLRLTLDAPLEQKTAPAFQCLSLDHLGGMPTIGTSWMKLQAVRRAAGRRPTGQSREVYKKWVSFDSPENITELQQGVA